ncbi:MAG: hypothetical protein PUC12_11190 [Clostridiales bacterium]|nr:hypothetical protein [Clostridiales bacterium]
MNKTFQCGYKVQEGECINLFQIDEMDGYEHDVTPVNEVTVSDNIRLTSIGSDIRILWNQNPTFADRTLVVNDSDYGDIKYAKDCYMGKVNLYKFSDWKLSMAAVEKVEEYLQQANGLKKEEQYYYRVSSYVKQYQQAKQSGQFFIFVMSFVVFVLWIAAMSISFLGVRSEQDEHRRMADSLHKIGVTKEQMAKYMWFRNFVRYVLPVVIGESIGLILVMVWNKAVYQMQFAVVMVEIGIAGLILLVVWVVSSKIDKNWIYGEKNN